MIGRKARWIAGTLVSAGLLIGSIGVAQAQPRYGYGRGYDRGWHHRHRGNGFGFGDAVGVAALVGAVAIVASSMSKDKQAAQGARIDNGPDMDGPPPADGTDYGTDVRGTNAPVTASRDDADFSDVAGSPAHEDQMTDACAVAARDEAQGRDGGYAEVRHMDTPVATGSGYNIDGDVETRASWRASAGTTRRFTCAIQNGRVAEVYLARDVAAR